MAQIISHRESEDPAWPISLRAGVVELADKVRRKLYVHMNARTGGPKWHIGTSKDAPEGFHVLAYTVKPEIREKGDE